MHIIRLAGLLFFGCAAPTLAAAQTPDKNRAAARALAFEAQAAFENKDYAGAADRFTRADTLFHAPTLLLGLARAQVGLRKLMAARETYARIVREGAGPKAPTVFTRAVEDAKRELAELEARMPKLRVTVVEPPPGIAVARDGVSVSKAAFDEALSVDPGPHEVSASAPGYRPEHHRVVTGEGELTSVTLVLVPLAPPQVTPILRADHEPVSREATTSSTPAAVPAPTDIPTQRPLVATARAPTWAWIAGGVGVGLVGAGVVFLVDNQAAIGALHDNCPTTGGVTRCKAGYDYNADNLRKNRDLALTIGLGGLGAVGLGVAVVGLARGATASSGKQAAVTAGMRALPQGLGAEVTGSF